MDRNATLLAATSAFEDVTGRIAALVGALPDLDAPLGGGSVWTVRQAAIHLADESYVDLVNGAVSPVTSLAPGEVADGNAQWIADIPESDPTKVAGLITGAGRRFVDCTAGRPADQEVTWHCGLRLDLAELVSINLGEAVLHGYDIATAVGVPWPIDPRHATLILDSYRRFDALIVNPETTSGLTAAYRVTLRGGPTFPVRFTDGHYRDEPGRAEPVDCEISADPVAFLLVRTGRLAWWPAFALGLISAGGNRRELALRFLDLLAFP